MNLFDLGIDYLASKITISILFLVSLINFKSNFNLRYYSKYLMPLILYFGVLTLVSFLNVSSASNNYFDFPFFLNIILFLILLNSTKIDKDILLKGLLSFAFGSIILTILYYFNINISDKGLVGRSTVFELNQNILGIILVISIFVLISIAFGYSPIFTKYKKIVLLIIPFLFVFMISTGSRTAFISFILGLILFIFFNKSIKKSRRILFSILLVPLFILIWTLFLKNSLVIERMGSTIGQGDLSSRDLIWFTTFDIISNNYWFGIGKTGYFTQIQKLFGDFASPHNVILETLCYTGIFGLLIFTVFFFRIIKTAITKIKLNGDLLPIMLLMPILGNLLSGQIYEIKIPWIIFAFVVSSVSNRSMKVPVSGQSKSQVRIHRKLLKY